MLQPTAHRPPCIVVCAALLIAVVTSLIATPLAARGFDRIVRPNPPVAVDMTVGSVFRDDAGRLALMYQGSVSTSPSLQFRAADGRLIGRIVPRGVDERKTIPVGNGPDGLLRVLVLGYIDGRLDAYRYDGSRAWSAPLGELTTDYRPIGIDASGSFWGAGATVNPGRALQVARYSRIGAPQLSVRIADSDLSSADAMVVDRDRQRAFVFGPNEAALHKPGALYRVAADGTQVRIWSTPANEAPMKMVLMDDGQLVLSTKVLDSTDVIHLHRVDANGAEVWNRTLESTGFVTHMIVAPGGKFDQVVARRHLRNDYNYCAVQERDGSGVLLTEVPIDVCATAIGRHPLSGLQVVEKDSVDGAAQLESFFPLWSPAYRINYPTLSVDADYQPTYAADGSLIVPTRASTVVAIDPRGGMRTLVDLHAVPIEQSRLWDASLSASGEAFEIGAYSLGNRYDYAAINPAGAVSWRNSAATCPGGFDESHYGHLQAFDQGPVWLQTYCGGLRPLARATGAPLWPTSIPLLSMDASYAVDASHLLTYGRFGPVPELVNPTLYRVDLGTQTPSPVSPGSASALGPVGPTGVGVYQARDGVHVIGPEGAERFTLPASPVLTVRAIGAGGQVLLTGSSPARLELRDATGGSVATWTSPVSLNSGVPSAIDAAGTAYAAVGRSASASVVEVAIVRLSAAQPAGEEIDRFPIPAGLVGGGTFLLPYQDLLLVISNQDRQALMRVLRPADHAVLRTEALDSLRACGCRWRIGDDGVLRGVVTVDSGYDSTVAVVALDQLLAPPTVVRLDQPGIGGAWYPPNLPGQGLTLDYFSDSHTLFGAWFVYSTIEENHGRQQRWFSLQAQVPAGASRLSLPIYRNSDGNFAAAPSTQAVQVGTAEITFSSCRRGSLRWQFDATAGNDVPSAGLYALERLGPTPADCSPADGSDSRAYDSALSGTWYPPEHSGQGFQLFVARGTDPFGFGAWFTYAPAGSALASQQSRHWFSLQDMTFAADGSLHGTLYETLGGQFATRAATNTRAVGRYDFRVVDCTHARIDWTFFDATIALDYGGLSGGDDLLRLGTCTR